MYYCHNCGYGLSDGAQFCGRCGTPRQAVAPTDWTPTTQPQSGDTQVLPKTPPYSPAPVQTVAPAKPAKTPMSGALKLLIGLGTVAMLVGAVVVATGGPGGSSGSNGDPLSMRLSEAKESCEKAMANKLGLSRPFTDFHLDEDQDYVRFWQGPMKARGLPYPVVQYTAIYPTGKADCVFESDGKVEFNQYSVTIPVG